MRFRFWLESDEIHPFQQWHSDYKTAYQKDRTAPWPHIGSYRQYPLSKALMNDPRRRQSAVLVLEVSGYSSGSHAYGPDTHDIPAGNPLRYPEWDVYVETPEQDAKLIGRTAVITDTSGGSFHERWGRLKVFVLVDYAYQDSEYDEPNTTLGSWQIDDKELQGVKGFFKYEGLEHAKQKLTEVEPDMAFPPLPGEDRRAYWARITAAEDERWIKPPADGYNDRDDYFKT